MCVCVRERERERGQRQEHKSDFTSQLQLAGTLMGEGPGIYCVAPTVTPELRHPFILFD